MEVDRCGAWEAILEADEITVAFFDTDGGRAAEAPAEADRGKTAEASLDTDEDEETDSDDEEETFWQQTNGRDKAGSTGDRRRSYRRSRSETAMFLVGWKQGSCLVARHCIARRT